MLAIVSIASQLGGFIHLVKGCLSSSYIPGVGQKDAAYYVQYLNIILKPYSFGFPFVKICSATRNKALTGEVSNVKNGLVLPCVLNT